MRALPRSAPRSSRPRGFCARGLCQSAATQYYPPQGLDRLVSRVALYPDPLLPQIFVAATLPDQISDAERWAD
jgi:hypothetical protein